MDVCSRSATAGAPPTRRRSRRCSRPPTWAAPLPARCLADDRRCSPRSANDVGFDLVFSRQLIAHADARRHRARHLDQRQLAQPARRVRRSDAGGDCSRSASRVTTVATWPRASTCSTASWCAPTASIASRRRRRHSVTRCGTRCRSGWRRRVAARAPDARERPLADDAARRRRRSARSSTASPSSVAGVRGCATTSSPWRTVPAARRRPRSSTRCSSRHSPTASAEPLPGRGDAHAADGRAARVQHRLVRREAVALPRRIDRSPGGARHRERSRGAGRAARRGSPSRS